MQQKNCNKWHFVFCLRELNSGPLDQQLLTHWANRAPVYNKQERSKNQFKEYINWILFISNVNDSWTQVKLLKPILVEFDLFFHREKVQVDFFFFYPQKTDFTPARAESCEKELTLHVNWSSQTQSCVSYSVIFHSSLCKVNGKCKRIL